MMSAEQRDVQVIDVLRKGAKVETDAYVKEVLSAALSSGGEA